jgi:hypothetical protein
MIRRCYFDQLHFLLRRSSESLYLIMIISAETKRSRSPLSTPPAHYELRMIGRVCTSRIVLSISRGLNRFTVGLRRFELVKDDWTILLFHSPPRTRRCIEFSRHASPHFSSLNVIPPGNSGLTVPSLLFEIHQKSSQGNSQRLRTIRLRVNFQWKNNVNVTLH